MIKHSNTGRAFQVLEVPRSIIDFKKNKNKNKKCKVNITAFSQATNFVPLEEDRYICLHQ